MFSCDLIIRLGLGVEFAEALGAHPNQVSGRDGFEDDGYDQGFVRDHAEAKDNECEEDDLHEVGADHEIENGWNALAYRFGGNGHHAGARFGGQQGDTAEECQKRAKIHVLKTVQINGNIDNTPYYKGTRWHFVGNGKRRGNNCRAGFKLQALHMPGGQVTEYEIGVAEVGLEQVGAVDIVAH